MDGDAAGSLNERRTIDNGIFQKI